MTDVATPSAHRGPLRRFLLAIWSLVLGGILATSAVTSVVLLGWLMRLMRRAALRTAGLTVTEADLPRWVLGPAGSGWATRLLGGLAGNIRLGVHATLSMAVFIFPVAAFWMSSWWAGWENSFNKGYEQAFVGPLLGVSGIAVFAVVMLWLPMGLAHQAIQCRPFAMCELRRVRSAVTHAGWGYVGVAMATLILALPVFASRGLPVFAEGIAPPLADMSAADVAQLRDRLDLLIGAYVFVTLVFLRAWVARVYARAVLRAAASQDRDLWTDTPLEPALPAPGTARRPVLIMRLFRTALLLAIWVGLAVLIFVGQFLNHDWHAWLSHPYTFLPWGL